MNARIHTKVTTAIAAAAMIAAAVAPCASADSAKGARVQIPPSLANFREPGSTGYVPQVTRVVIPPALSHFREPGSTGFVPQAAPLRAVTVAADGFDWGAAVIGAGAALGLALASAGALMALRKRRTLAHV